MHRRPTETSKNPILADYPYPSHYLDLEGTRLHYLDEGSGEPVLLIHGNPTWSYYYRHLVSVLRKTHRVIVPDHIGCGLSDKPPEYHYILANHIDNLSRLIEQLQLTGISLVVHDWGGAIGFGYATRHPGNLKKLVVLNTAAFRSRRIPYRIRMCRWPWLGKILVQGFNGFARAAITMAVTRPMSRQTARGYLFPYDSWSNRCGIYGFVRDIPLHAGHRSYAQLLEIETGLTQLRDQRVPILILWGGQDFCFDRIFYEQWRTLFPEAQSRYFEDAGHYLLEDKHGVIEPIIEEFLQSPREVNQ